MPNLEAEAARRSSSSRDGLAPHEVAHGGHNDCPPAAHTPGHTFVAPAPNAAPVGPNGEEPGFLRRLSYSISSEPPFAGIQRRLSRSSHGSHGQEGAPATGFMRRLSRGGGDDSAIADDDAHHNKAGGVGGFMRRLSRSGSNTAPAHEGESPPKAGFGRRLSHSLGIDENTGASNNGPRGPGHRSRRFEEGGGTCALPAMHV